MSCGRKTLDSEDWVSIVRGTLERLGIGDPAIYLPDGNVIRALGMDALIDLCSSNIFEMTPRYAESWLCTRYIEPTKKLVDGLIREFEALYNNQEVRENILMPIYSSGR